MYYSNINRICKTNLDLSSLPAAMESPFFKSLATLCGSIWYNKLSVFCFSASRRRDVFFSSAVVSSNVFLIMIIIIIIHLIMITVFFNMPFSKNCVAVLLWYEIEHQILCLVVLYFVWFWVF